MTTSPWPSASSGEPPHRSATTHLPRRASPPYAVGMALRLTLLALALVAASSCSTRMGRWEYVNKQAGKLKVIPRAETADSGSGAAASAGYKLQRVTIGGSYLRRTDVTDSLGQPRLRAGLHNSATTTP
jgi:hypothetical protein